MPTTDILNVKLTSDNSDYKRGMQEAADTTEKTAKTVDTLGDSLKNVKSILVGFGVGKLIKDSYSAYTTQLLGETMLTQSMQKRMGATYDEVRAVKELASAQQQIGVIGDEIQLAGAAQIASFAAQKSSVEALIPAMNDLVAFQYKLGATEGSAASVGEQLGRALQGNYTMLQRQGIVFSDAQKHILEYGNEEQRAAVLAEAIEAKVGGMNAALRQTDAGQLKALQNDLGDLQEEIGSTFAPIVSTVAPIIKQVATDLKPVILDIARGISYAATSLQVLENPAVRAIGYGVTAVFVLGKLKNSLSTASLALMVIGGALAYVFGEAASAEDDITKSAQNMLNGFSTAGDEAAKSYENVNEEIGKTEKAMSRLAGFDKINKLSGGSSDDKFITDENIDNANAYADIMSSIKDYEAPEIPELKFPEINWDEVFSRFAEKAYKDLRGLNNGLKDIMRGIFGDDIADAWEVAFTNLGKNLEGFAELMFEGLDKVSNSRLMKYRDQLLNDPVWGEINTFFFGIGDWIEDMVSGGQKEKEAVIGDLVEMRTEALQYANDLMRGGATAEEAFAEALSTLTYKNNSEMINSRSEDKDTYLRWAKQYGYELRLDDVQANWEILSSTGQLGTVNNADAVDHKENGANWNNGGIPSTEINFTAYFDGEEIAAKTEARTANRINETNGRQ